MLLRLEKTKRSDLEKLFAFAKQNSLQLSLVDADKTKTYLPGEALSTKELKQLVTSSRKSGTMPLEKAHQQIRKKLNGVFSYYLVSKYTTEIHLYNIIF